MYLVFDEETETHHGYKRKANPFLEQNWIVARGWKRQGDKKCSWTYHPEHDRTTYLSIPEQVTLLVGFNIKFDLLWEMAQGNPDLYAFYKRGGKIWDCQYVEYLLEAQKPDAQMCSLNDTAPKYGGTTKIDEVKALWQAGKLTSEIPEDLLIDYLVGTEEEGRNGGDIRNTELVFLGQAKRAVEQGQLKMIQDRMDGLLATTDMEFRGIKIDVAEAGKRLRELNAELSEATESLDAYIPDDLPFTFNWGSRVHSSCLIFGGTVKYQKQAPYKDPETGEWARSQNTETHYVHKDGSTHPTEPGVTFLSGKRKGEYKTKKVRVPGDRKVKYQDFFYTFPGHTKANEEWATKNLDGYGAPLYSTNSDVIEVITSRNIPFLQALCRKQELDKEIGTYYVKTDPKTGEYTGMLTCVQHWDHMLHHKLNHAVTVTTRLSSSDPNLQNVPRADKSEVKKMFVSRFGKDGAMIEADYSQLEVVVQGVLSGDKQLCEDLRNKIDFHCKRVSAKFGCTYDEALVWCKDENHPDYNVWKPRRTGVKEFSFQRAYGAGAAAIAASTGMGIEDVQELIRAEEEMYPGVALFNADVEGAVMKSATPFQAPNTDGYWQTFRRGYWQAPTGTLYSWRSYEAPEYSRKRGIKDSFSPPEMKNYPIQGTGGEFVQAMLGLLWRHFVAKDFYGGKAFLINTVHDCVWIDCHKDVLDEVAADVKRILESVPEFYNKRHGMDIQVPFPVEVEYGQNMMDLHHWN
ncbi:DNA polymerase A family protein [Kaustia mangrovi]|uniref:DNA-directed DNA polymerase n=1 Tax=Kaustia mangrovi TaxID=2593653 RepID=A0A7S8C814_9HYPH|nr:DNA polymerase [Kaustia mangrovi]QPC44944.1 DNA polymerase A family protein [Kaustia mangrovi]